MPGRDRGASGADPVGAVDGRAGLSAGGDGQPLLARLGPQMSYGDFPEGKRKRLLIGRFTITIWILAVCTLVYSIAVWRFGLVKQLNALPDIVYCEIYQ